MIVQELLDEYIKECIARGNAEYTIKHYQCQIKAFTKFYNGDISKITYETYQDYIIYLKSKYNERRVNEGKKIPLSGRTIKTYASALRTLLRYGSSKGYIDKSIVKDLKMPKYKKKIIEILSDEEIELLINACDKNTFTGSRDLFIIALMLESGLRLSEVVRLSINDIDVSRNIIRIDGKCNKERIVPFTCFLKECYTSYTYMYCQEFGHSIKGKAIKTKENTDCTRDTISLIFRRLRKKTGISNLHPHLLRHTFATMFLMNGGNIENLRLILGHTTLNMVLTYLHLVNSLNISSQSQYSPMSNIKKD